MDIIDKQYHKGFVVKAYLYYFNTTILDTSEERSFSYGGNIIIYDDLTTFRAYVINLYSITHEGWSAPSSATFVTMETGMLLNIHERCSNVIVLTLNRFLFVK